MAGELWLSPVNVSHFWLPFSITCIIIWMKVIFIFFCFLSWPSFQTKHFCTPMKYFLTKHFVHKTINLAHLIFFFVFGYDLYYLFDYVKLNVKIIQLWSLLVWQVPQFFTRYAAYWGSTNTYIHASLIKRRLWYASVQTSSNRLIAWPRMCMLSELRQLAQP